MLRHALRFAREGVEALRLYIDFLANVGAKMPSGAIPRPGAAALGILEKDVAHLEKMDEGLDSSVVAGLRERIKSRDAFTESRTYRPVHGEIRPGALGDIRSLKNFYG